MQFNGYKYLVNAKRNESTYYQCLTDCSTQCKGNLITKRHPDGEIKVCETGEHTCNTTRDTKLRDCIEEMRQTLEAETARALTIIPYRLWDRVSRQLDDKYPDQAVQVMPQDEAINFIKYMRRQAYACRRLNAQHHTETFTETLIIVGHDAAYDVYVLVLFVLTEAKDEWTYWHCLHWMKMSPSSITCDFEAAFINTGRHQLDDIPASRRKLHALIIPANQIEEAMSPGMLAILTVIPIDEIQSKGIPFVMSKLSTLGAVRQWTEFWTYFTRT
ncbi:hypothetical protein P3T76_010795 [Phytophthora citrophthora]|uniref:FLYWCH-type domain-containing protein n=1 Tax=Phytophthora citrophthora TaxID=4793 RepID=A0AAD9GAY1_9STRA|nr:hypothetical protein P3T76_010795 [Phytophthora citrophthora]